MASNHEGPLVGKAGKINKRQRNHKITEYFPVRRSTRRTAEKLRNEENEKIESLIRTGYYEDFLRIYETEDKGRGIKAGRSFSKDEFVVEYRGETLSAAEGKRREQEYAQDAEIGSYIYFFAHGNQRFCVDATLESPYKGRLVNHSYLKPNLKSKMSSPILRIMVVGFHHTKGSQVEYCYPPLPEMGGDIILPHVWESLPNLAMPDGSHNSLNGDTVYFTLPSPEESHRTVFGIACYRHINSDQLLQKDSGVTRSHVQKSVVVLSCIPLYGNLRAKLELITEAYFNEKDFTKVDVLRQTFVNLTDLFTYDFMDNQAIYMGLPLHALLSSFKHQVLELVKLLLLEKRIIFNITPTSRLSNVLMGLVSLFPCMLEDGLTEAAIDSKLAANSDPLMVNKYGFPLSIFTKGYLFHPYISVDWIEKLRSNFVRGYCVGVTNSIFRSSKDLYDVYVTIDDNDIGSINIADPKLEKLAELTTQDMRFMQNILQEVEGSTPSEFTGNDDWVRLQIYSYICSLLIVEEKEDSDHYVEYNTEFLKAWRNTHNFRVWSSGNHDCMPDIPSEHPCSGPIGAQDLLIMVGRRINNSGQGRKMISTINTTAKYVSDQGHKLKSTFLTWMSKPGQP